MNDFTFSETLLVAALVAGNIFIVFLLFSGLSGTGTTRISSLAPPTVPIRPKRSIPIKEN